MSLGESISRRFIRQWAGLVAEEIGPQRVNNRKDKRPQNSEEREAEDEKGEFAHLRRPTRIDAKVGELINVGGLGEHAEYNTGSADLDDGIRR